MSGRLVILRHKSWHVWNQDNQEKVLRDERIQKEQEEELKSKKRGLLQEEQRGVLLQNGKKISEDIQEATNARFCLFDDPESVKVARLENEEYVKEMKEKERNLRKKEGVADWSLSEGNNIVPWYSKVPKANESSLSSSSSLTQQVASSSAGIRTFDSDKKRVALDPASKFLTQYTVPNINVHDSLNDSLGRKVAMELKESKECDEQTKRKHKKEKKEKRSKKDKKKGKENRHENSKADHSAKESAPTIPATIDENGALIAELRKRRLEREREERHRAAVMLAERDIYGSSRSTLAKNIQADSRGHNYNQRYNPNLSRN